MKRQHSVDCCKNWMMADSRVPILFRIKSASVMMLKISSIA